jgi:1-acyl-sn-glycerol-3-phosphate acyltransferase/nicotinic acid mononucleotide adenylyltransferase
MTGTDPNIPNDPHKKPPSNDDELQNVQGAANQDEISSDTFPSREVPLYERTDEMWEALGVSDLKSAIGPDLPLGDLAERHLQEHPFEAYRGRIQRDSMLWYEGSFDPIGVHHFKIFYDTIRELGFERATLAIVYRHPVKTSLAYEHRYAMAKAVLETAGFNVVDDYEKDGICLLPPGRDGLNAFHVARQEALYNPKNFILIGPDNFDRALETNILWTHVDGVKNSVSGRERYGFRSMYEAGIAGLKDRLIVYPRLNSVHSTNIRNGEVPMLGPVKGYVEAHGLYSSSTNPAPSTPKTSTTPAPTPGQVSLRNGATTREEMDLRSDLLVKVGTGFTWSFPATRELYQAILGAADRSELRGLQHELDKCRDRMSVESSPGAKYFFDKRQPLATKLVSLMSDTVIGNDIQIRGVEHVARVHDVLGARIIFVANESGWGDIPVFTHALNRCRLGGLAENLTFVYKRDVFETPVLAGLVGHSATVIKPTAAVAASEADVQVKVHKAALQRGLDQLTHGPVVLFPENSTAERAPFELASIGPEVVEGLQKYISANEDPDITPDKVFVIPVGMVGGSYLKAGKASEPFSSDYPAVVQFGCAIPITNLLDVAREYGDEVAGHVIGHRVANLLPTEWRGPYATGASNSPAQEDARKIVETSSRTDEDSEQNT